MLEVTVKTLDSQNHSFTVPDESTVKEFKEQISPVLKIPVEKQRLIFCGKVLKDEKKLNEYDVNGKVIHVVQSLPPQGNASASSSASSTNTSNSSNPNAHRQALRDAAGFVLGAFTIPQDLIDPNHVQNIVQEVVSGMGELGRNTTVISRSTEDGPSVDLRINLGQIPFQSEAQLRMNRVQSMIQRANQLIDTLEEGNGSNSASETSSRTDNDDEFQNGLLEAETVSSTNAERNENSESHTETGEAQDETPMVTTEAEIPVVTDRFGLEGFAQVAQAALSAAIATATAAARAATSTMTSQSSTNESSDTLPNLAASAIMTDDLPIPIAEYLRSESSPIIANVSSIPMEAEFEAELTTERTLPRTSADADVDADASGTAETSTAGASDASANTSQSNREPQRPSVQTFANLIDEVIRVNSRMEPCLEKLRDLVRTDPVLTGQELTNASRLFRKVSKLLHFLSHAYHSLSDLHIHFPSRPPRSPRVRIISSSQTVFHQTIPLQTQINISGTVVSVNSTSTSSTTTTANNSATATSTTASSAAPNVPEARLFPATSPRNGLRNSAVRLSPYSPLGMSSSGRNPMFYMEVTPGSITIDSISSSVGNSGSANASSESTDAPSRETPNPPASTANSRSRPEATSTDSQTTTSQSATSRSQPTASSQGGMLPPLRHLIPVPLTSMGSLQTFDSALPCHSVWALELTRRRHNAGSASAQQNNIQQRSSASGVEASAHIIPQRNGFQIPIPSPNAPGRQDEQLQGLNSALQNISQAFTVLSSLHGENGSGREGSSNRPRRERTSRYGRPQSMTAEELFMHDEQTFEQAFQDLIDFGPRRDHAIAVGLECTEFTLYSEDDLFTGLFWMLARELKFGDIAEAVHGNIQVLDKLEKPLKKFISEKLQYSPDDQNVDIGALAEKIISEIASFFPDVEPFRTKAEISYGETMVNFLKSHIIDVLNALTAPLSGSQSYGEVLSTVLKKLWKNFLNLHYMCCSFPSKELKKISRSIHALPPNRLLSKLVLVFNAWFAEMISKVISSLPSSDSEPLKKFIVYNTPQAKKDEESKEPVPPTDKTPKPRENAFESRSSAERHAAPSLADFARIAGQCVQNLRGAARSTDTRNSSPNLTEVVIGSDAWHNTLPRDWVPIIARDVQRQRRQAPQSPFSNAYLSGMPSKRRKIMTNNAPALLQHSQSTLCDLLQQAISNANVKPLTSTDAVKKDASKDINLQAAFSLHMKNSIQERLQTDLDYCSEKFPNARKYYDIDQV